MNASGTQSTSAGPARTPPRADEATLKLVEELKNLAVDVLGRGIERMFDGADDMLFEMARRATNNKDQRVYFDTMRVVRLGRPKIGRIFREQIAHGFLSEEDEQKESIPTDVSFDDLSLQESKSLEESIAISTMATKAEGLYNQLLFELNRRLNWLIKERGAPIDPTCMAPATISKAFRRSAESLDVEFDIELVIFKLFDRLVISDLGELYTRALRFFDQHGVQAAAIGGGAPRAPGGPSGGAAGVGAAAAAAGGAASGSMVPGGMPMPMSGVPGGLTGPTPNNAYGFAAPPMVDPQTLGQLRQISTSMVPAANVPTGMAYYSDSQLGGDLANAASGQVVPGWEPPRAFAYVQRAGVVGRMFNDILQDPTLPASLKPRFDQLRFSVIKNALQDSAFFADKQHPVRTLMNELATMAATARATGMETLRRMEDMVTEIQGQFDVAADSIRTQTALPGPVDEKTIEDFFAQQKEEARQRRQAIIDRTRKVVAEELHLRTLSKHVPDGVWPLLNSGWAPLMALRLLKQGPDSDAWRDGIELLDRTLDSGDARKVAAWTDEMRDSLAYDIESRLRDIGMLDERIAVLIRSWREAVEAIAPVAPAKARITHADALLEDIHFGDEAAPAASTAEGEAAEEAAAPIEEIQAHPEGDAGLIEEQPSPDAAPVATTADAGDQKIPDAVTLLDLLMVLSSWFRVYDHDRRQSRWLKVVAHHPADGTVTFAEFNGQNKLQLRTQVFLDDLVAGRAEPIDLGPAAKRALDAFLAARRADVGAEAA